MRLNIFELLTLSSAILTQAAPFQVQDGELQRHRRRAVDYPVKFVDAPAQPARRLRKRAAASYSVVQVDGQSSTTAAPAPPAATITVTQSGSTPAASTQTVLVTSVIPGPTSDETIVITTTQEVSAISTSVATAPAQTVTSAVAPAAPATVTAVSIATPNGEESGAGSSTEVDQVTSMVTNTMVETITATAATSTPTAYYDDGLWHTYYPIKSFVPPPSAGFASTVNARAAAPTGLSQLGLKNASSVAPAYTPAASSGWAAQARRWLPATPAAHPYATPVAYSDQRRV